MTQEQPQRRRRLTKAARARYMAEVESIASAIDATPDLLPLTIAELTGEATRRRNLYNMPVETLAEMVTITNPLIARILVPALTLFVMECERGQRANLTALGGAESVEEMRTVLVEVEAYRRCEIMMIAVRERVKLQAETLSDTQAAW